MEIKLKKHIQKSSHRNIFPPKYLEYIFCPLCNSKTYTQKYPKYYPRIVTCAKCELIYTNPRLKNKYLKELYTEEYFKNDHSSILGYSSYLQDRKNVGKYVNFSLFTDRVELYNKAVGTIFNAAQFVLPKDLSFYVNPFDIMCVYAKKK